MWKSVELLEEELKIPIYLAESPLTSVAEGTGIMLNNLYLLDWWTSM